MGRDSVNYDRIASVYSRRYSINPLPGVAATLHSLAQLYRAGRVLEVGCGTGRWLEELQLSAPCVVGLDRSAGMLGQASHRPGNARLVVGDAGRLPFPGASYDMVFCVNALHHFGEPRDFIAEAHRMLRPGGRLAIVGMDPHAGQEEWYIYQYFPETYELDLERFPPGEAILGWMKAAGFAGVERRRAEHIRDQHAGRDILDDYFLGKQATSQLTLLSDAAYAAGLERIRAALERAEAAGETLVFPVDIALMLFTGEVRTTDEGLTPETTRGQATKDG
jgi:SAM-dependent methyltransferase